MLAIKDIEKIKDLYYHKHCTVTYISRNMKLSKNTIYKYLKMQDFNYTPVFTKENPSMDAYADIISCWLKEDLNHHYKQRHTAKRIYQRLKSEVPDFNLSYSTVNNYYKTQKQQLLYEYNGFLPLSHSPGEAQVDFGECSFFTKDMKINGYFLVLSFPYSNASYCQLMQSKNAEASLQALKKIFEFLHGVPHTIWFDNDPVFTKIKNEETITRYFSSLFTRFKLHYMFKDVFCSPNKCNEKGNVESNVKYLRRNLLVPLPSFTNLDEYNLELLQKCSILHNRRHYLTNSLIADIHYEDLLELNPLNKLEFEVLTLRTKKADSFGRIIIDRIHSYYLGPNFAGNKIFIKIYPYTVTFLKSNGDEILSTERLFSITPKKFFNAVPYFKLLLNKPKAINNFDFSEILSNNEIDILLNSDYETRKKIISNYIDNKLLKEE